MSLTAVKPESYISKNQGEIIRLLQTIDGISQCQYIPGQDKIKAIYKNVSVFGYYGHEHTNSQILADSINLDLCFEELKAMIKNGRIFPPPPYMPHSTTSTTLTVTVDRVTQEFFSRPESERQYTFNLVSKDESDQIYNFKTGELNLEKIDKKIQTVFAGKLQKVTFRSAPVEETPKIIKMPCIQLPEGN